METAHALRALASSSSSHLTCLEETENSASPAPQALTHSLAQTDDYDIDSWPGGAMNADAVDLVSTLAGHSRTAPELVSRLRVSPQQQGSRVHT